MNSNALRNILNVTLDNEWNLYWFQAEQYMRSEIEIEDLRTCIDNVELDSSLAGIVGWHVELSDVDRSL